MITNKNFFLFFMILGSLYAFSQKQQLMISNFENKPSTVNWWRDNENVKFIYDETKSNQYSVKSKVSLHVRWNLVPQDRPFAWFTDLKADTLAVEGMEKTWMNFKEKTWMSFWCKAGEGDTLMLHFLVLNKGHKSKWGATKMIPLTSKKWQFVKVKFSDLEYENWGVIKGDFNLKEDIAKCFEVGLRLSSSSPKGFVEAWFDDIQLTNYEPFR
ncbi:hypothetical protein [Flavobacterium sp. N3904]|uniref:hypothetical protein n=1 Tax=Flavobacterium sp. N3904 TaxID=2986835 RepID=UPI0022240E50|nr:hypothetical protein [Flavobacterium sp. N3904]